MTHDPSKMIDIDYNHLNLPRQIDFGPQDNIQYAYTSTGARLRKTVSTQKTTAGSVTDYCGNFIYADNQLITIFAGYVRVAPVNVGNSVYWKYEYSMKDHTSASLSTSLGNVRVVFAAHSHGQPELLQQTSYYPGACPEQFGRMTMQQQNFYSQNATENKYLYNSKELQDDQLAGNTLDWYDYGARFYDVTLGRWHVVDPHAEYYVSWTPYNYVFNNPTNGIDPDGKDGKLIKDGNNLTVQVMLNYSQESLDRYNSSVGTFSQEQLEHDFNNYYVAANGEYEIGGQTYNVSFKISFNVVETDNDMPSADSQDGSTNLVFRADKDGAGSHKENTISLNKSPRGMAGAEDTGGTLSHEIVHALGVPDTKEYTSGKLSSYSGNRSLKPSEVSIMLTPSVKFANDNNISKGSILITHSRPTKGRKNPKLLHK
jgi:RHS repeat-associated protein